MSATAEERQSCKTDETETVLQVFGYDVIKLCGG